MEQKKQMSLDEVPPMPQIDIGVLKPIDSKRIDFDLDAVHMQQVKIEKVEVTETLKGWENNVFTTLPKPRKQLLVISENLSVRIGIKTPDVEIHAREWFNLIETEDGTIGWSTNEKGNLHRFMKVMRVKTPSELIGKLATIKVVEGKTEDKNPYLRYVY